MNETVTPTVGRSVPAVVRQVSEEVSVMKARIKFRKYGALRFIGHLDVMRYFRK